MSEKDHDAGDADVTKETETTDEHMPASETPTADAASDTEPDAAKDAPADKAHEGTKAPRGQRLQRLKHWAAAHKVWASAACALVVLVLLAAVPWTRYKIAGLFIKQTVTVVVDDSQTNAPVTGASVTLAGVRATTDNRGVAKLHVRAGSASGTVAKAYYRTASFNTVVPIFKPKHSLSVSFVATGRQVPITVVDKISGKPVENAEVKAAGSEAKTDANGTATIVLPPGSATVAATVTADKYNAAGVTIQVTTAAVPANKLALTPAGKLYFLSNLSGKIDVVKTNLDGSARQTVLAGSGFEDPNNTSLLASRDWKYLALYSIRTAGGSAQLNLIDATNGDKLSNIDEGTNVYFTPIGWDGDAFVYTVERSDVQFWQPHKEALKSFDAQTGKITVLDQTTATGSNTNDYLRNFFQDTYILDGNVVYTTGWDSGSFASTRAGQNPLTLTSIRPDGSNKKVMQVGGANAGFTYETLYAVPYEANGLYLENPSGATPTFYTYEDGAVKPNTTLTSQTFYTTPYSTYLLSPSGNQTFWAVAADGKNNLFVGDQNGDSGKQLATLSDYNVYGWFSDNYLLVSKNSSELYILPVSGGTALKVSDYYKPARNFYGYGSGYGGL